MPNRRRSVSLIAILATGLTTIVSAAGCTASSADENAESQAAGLHSSPPTLTLLGSYKNAGGSIEISAYDKRTKRLFSVNSTSVPSKIEVIDISNPAAPALVGSIVNPAAGTPNSVAVHKGLVVVAWEAINRQDNGTAVFYDAATLATLGSAPVGAVPDMLTFTKNGKQVLVANEGEPAPDYARDPEGSVTIIDVDRRHWGYSFASTTVSFLPSTPVVNPESVRVFGGGTFGAISVPLSTPPQDYEPEYITISDDGRTAYVTLQENNAIAVLDIKRKKFEKVIGLGFKDHSLPGNGMDVSDRDGPLMTPPGPNNSPFPGNIGTWPVKGIYMPDSIGHFSDRGRDYFVMANEGDAREWGTFVEEARVRSLVPNPITAEQPGKLCPDNPAVLSGAANDDKLLGRLTVTTKGIPTRPSGCFPEIYSFGARSFTVRDRQGNIVWDSGDEIEQRMHTLLPGFENSDQTAAPAPDTRSDNKGPEAEGLTVAKIRGTNYAFVGLERIGGVLMYDLDNPRHPKFVTYVNNRTFSGPTPGGDLGPEGLLVISKKDSPTNKPLLVISNEISGSATFYQIDGGGHGGHDDDCDSEDDHHDD
jgi:hypothetical protein